MDMMETLLSSLDESFGDFNSDGSFSASLKVEFRS